MCLVNFWLLFLDLTSVFCYGLKTNCAPWNQLSNQFGTERMLVLPRNRLICQEPLCVHASWCWSKCSAINWMVWNILNFLEKEFFVYQIIYCCLGLDHPLIDAAASTIYLPCFDARDGETVFQKSFVFGTCIVKMGEISATHQRTWDSWSLNPYVHRELKKAGTNAVFAHWPAQFPVHDLSKLQFDDALGHRQHSQVNLVIECESRATAAFSN